MKEKVVLGLSGGVDSAVSGAMLKEQGFEVTGVYLENGSKGEEDAKRVARDLAIDFVSVDIAKELEERVISPFVKGYLEAVTPIPCIVCNPLVKFKALFDIADKIGAKYVATGHYAQIEVMETGERILHKSPSGNDQSYMLYRLPKEYINRIIFPLGNVVAKDEVRAEAEARHIHIAKKPDSMEICFIPNDDHGAFIENRHGELPKGDFVDESGKVLGRHMGIHRYTVGQRKGLGVSAATRLFVKNIDTESNRVILSSSDLYSDSVKVKSLHITFDSYREKDSFDCTCKVRHSKTEYPAKVVVSGEEAEVQFRTPARAPAPGQSAVFYDGERVIGGGFIMRE